MAVSAVPYFGARAAGCSAIAHALRRRAHGESDHSDVRFGSDVSERGSECYRGGEQGVLCPCGGVFGEWWSGGECLKQLFVVDNRVFQPLGVIAGSIAPN